MTFGDYDLVDEFEDEKPRRKPKYPHAKEVFALWGVYPRNWLVNKTQLQSAENLYTERGISEITNALKWYSKVKDVDFAPKIDTPYDLDSKWAKLERIVEQQ